MTIPLTLTDAAKARIQELASKRDGAKGIVLRVAKGKGCGGYEYKMEYMLEDQPGFDKIEAGSHAALYVPVTDSFLMFGMEIDFCEDGLGGARFQFKNPNESGRCGCGESFSIDPGKLSK